MIKKTLYFGNPAYLSLKNEQMVIKLPDVEHSNLHENLKDQAVTTIPIEDIGVVILDNSQITITQGLIAALMQNTVAFITCDNQRMPTGLLLPLEGNTVQNERFRMQLDMSLPLRKQLWQQTVVSKIENQGFCLQKNTTKSYAPLMVMAGNVKSGDPDNFEAQAAVYYWKNIFPTIPDFIRARDGLSPNHLLNYGYAILRAVIARSLVSSGLLPVYGIHHHNRYNAYCLADDIMEPYRPFVDDFVISVMQRYEDITKLTTEIKRDLLAIPVLDVRIDNKRSPLMIAATTTCASLVKCIHGEIRRIAYPSFV
ncbi:MAG: type II CRISPR-associated endonuclease Cas1 [Prevotella sp.]